MFLCILVKSLVIAYIMSAQDVFHLPLQISSLYPTLLPKKAVWTTSTDGPWPLGSVGFGQLGTAAVGGKDGGMSRHLFHGLPLLRPNTSSAKSHCTSRQPTPCYCFQFPLTCASLCPYGPEVLALSLLALGQYFEGTICFLGHW